VKDAKKVENPGAQYSHFMVQLHEKAGKGVSNANSR
jgi:hypothetical protein